MSDDFNLPEELLLEILVRVPAEDLVKFTAVCKSWNSVIKNPNFISTHLGKTISSSNSRRLLLFRLCSLKKRRVVENYSLRFDNEDVNKYKQLHFPSNKFRSVSRCFSVLGTYNGLVCLVDNVSSCDGDYNLILWNPVIKKAIHLPQPSISRYCPHGPYCSLAHYDAFIGFGFDSKTNDYKLLRYVVLYEYGESIEAEIYSLNANCWTSITSFAPNYSPLYRSQDYYGNSFVNGAIHLLACDRKDGRKRNLILGFDVCEEVFSEIPLPHHLSNAYHLFAELLKYRESSIATVTWECEPSFIELWVMKEYGVATSWTKVWMEAPRSVPRVFFFRQEDEQVFMARNDGCIASLDTKTKHSKAIGVWSLEGYTVVDSYVESLVLLDKCCIDSQWDVISIDEDDEFYIRFLWE